MKKRILLFVSALLTTVGALAQASITLETLPENSLGQTVVLSMSLDNKMVVKSFQADVTLPDFITFNNVAPQVTARTHAFEVDYRCISEHQMRIVVSSATNSKLQADSAAVVNFNVAVANVEDVAGKVIKVTQAAAILENYRKVEMVDTAFYALAVKPSFVIRYEVDGEECYRDTLMQGELVTPLVVPTKEGYTFSGWSEIPETMPAENVVLIGEYRLNEEQTDAQGLTYRLNEARDAFAVSGYTADMVANVMIPETLYGLPVNTIHDKALYGAYGLEAIIVPASVSKVGTQAFGGCHNLLVMEWNAAVPLRAECFDEAEAYGNMLVIANAETDFTGNVVVNGVAEEITLTDGLPFRNPKNFTAKCISYAREFDKKTRIGVAGGWEGMVLPFDVQRIISEEKGELQPFGMKSANAALPCWIAEMHEDATFGLVDKISANRPFIMEVPNSDEYEDVFNIEGIVNFISEDVTVHATEVQSVTSESGFLFTGTYESVVTTPYVYTLNEEEYTGTDGSVFLPGGTFVSDLRDVRPFEAYAYHAQPILMRYLSIHSGTATGIERILKDENKLVDIYTLQGVIIKRQIPIEKLKNELPRGIYIIDGKKLLVK